MADYKGIYYNDDNNNQKVFEGGAYFKYNQLYQILENLVLEQKKRMKKIKLIQNKNKKKKEKMEKSRKLLEKISRNTDSNFNNVSFLI